MGVTLVVLFAFVVVALAIALIVTLGRYLLIPLMVFIGWMAGTKLVQWFQSRGKR